jgi:S1-C subfamily serine protease
MIFIKNQIWLVLAAAVMLSFLSCKSTDESGDSFPLRSTSSIRLEDIEKQIDENPVSALNLIFIYKEIYQVNQDEPNDDWKQLSQYEEKAVQNLVVLRDKAVEEEKWEEALSYGRSLESIGITAAAGTEAAYVLADARKKLSEGDNIAAFLAAVRAHEMRPLDYESALLFLGKAVEGRQRRTAAFFYNAATGAGGAAGGRTIPAALREYATGRDSVSDMVKGVATVIVDRGFRVERGMGSQNRVSGSAFFIDASGLLITNYHVISSEVDPKYKGYSRLYVRMGDSSSPRIPARVIGYDKSLDLALIKTEIETEYVFSIVDRVIPRVGDTVLAIGTPLGLLEKTVTSGIVSALGRRLQQLGDSIQMDAAINPGNSGGPVIDSDGRLVGVAFAGVAQFQGLNFVIPAERLSAALPGMLKGGRAQRPWLGFSLCETYSKAEIIYTAPNTPASLHRLREGSFITSVNGRASTAEQGGLIPALQSSIFAYNPGELVAIETVDEEGVTKRNVMMTVARPEIPLLEAANIDRRERITAPLFGMLLAPLQSSFFSTSYRVTRVVRGSIADEAGVSEDDPVSINRLRILETEGGALLEISIKKRRHGYLETTMQLPVWIDTPDTF